MFPRHDLEQIIRIKDAQLDMLEERIKLLEARNEVLEWDIDRLKQGLSQPRPQPSPTPLWMDEEEEDIQFARDAGLIGLAEANDMLRELEFDNPVVVPDDMPL